MLLVRKTLFKKNKCLAIFTKIFTTVLVLILAIFIAFVLRILRANGRCVAGGYEERPMIMYTSSRLGGMGQNI